MADLDNFDAAKALAESIGITVEKSWGLGRIVTEIFDEVAEAHLIQPTFITEYPAEVSPLARRNDVNPEITDRFEFFIGGREIGNGFSELNDAEDQAERFQSRLTLKLQVTTKPCSTMKITLLRWNMVCRQPLV